MNIQFSHSCRECHAMARCVGSLHEVKMARLVVRCCPSCGAKSHTELGPGGRKPNEKLRGKLHQRALQFGGQVRAGVLRYQSGMWIPVPKREPLAPVVDTTAVPVDEVRSVLPADSSPLRLLDPETVGFDYE